MFNQLLSTDKLLFMSRKWKCGHQRRQKMHVPNCQILHWCKEKLRQQHNKVFRKINVINAANVITEAALFSSSLYYTTTQFKDQYLHKNVAVSTVSRFKGSKWQFSRKTISNSFPSTKCVQYGYKIGKAYKQLIIKWPNTVHAPHCGPQTLLAQPAIVEMVPQNAKTQPKNVLNEPKEDVAESKQSNVAISKSLRLAILYFNFNLTIFLKTCAFC